MVPVVGVEPTRYHYHGILSPARLPIPSHRHLFDSFYMIHHKLHFVNIFLKKIFKICKNFAVLFLKQKYRRLLHRLYVYFILRKLYQCLGRQAGYKGAYSVLYILSFPKKPLQRRIYIFIIFFVSFHKLNTLGGETHPAVRSL